jgi:hypothetical protein
MRFHRVRNSVDVNAVDIFKPSSPVIQDNDLYFMFASHQLMGKSTDMV